jgi:serine/threonine-protein kinase
MRAEPTVHLAPPAEPDSLLVPGYKLDRYELLCPIAEGGMASVWVARLRGKHDFQKLVAIKTILPKDARDPRFQKMFLDEARIASHIEHANVAQIFDLGEENEILYLAMEYVEGDSLSKLYRSCLKKRSPIPTPLTLRVLADACRGLHEAHELSDAQGRPLEIVHRDVSPQNIVVSVRGVVKVIDFGIAKAQSRMGSDTKTGILKGKIQYMSPEQAFCQTVDRRADIWAVGAVLYHLLAGQPPYDADSQMASLELLRSGLPPRPLPATVPAPLAALVKKALSYAPEARFETAAEMGDALEQVMSEAGLPATNAQVGAFLREHLAQRLEKRRQAIDLALVQAAERSRARGLSEAKVQALLASPAREPAAAKVRPSRKPVLFGAGVAALATLAGVGLMLRGQPAVPLASASAMRATPPSTPAAAPVLSAAPEAPFEAVAVEELPRPRVLAASVSGKASPRPTPASAASGALQGRAAPEAGKNATIDDGF